jgi:calcium-dependent protein kinase
MGPTTSKTENNKLLKQIGENALKNEKTIPMKLTNEIIISGLKNKPEEDYKIIKLLHKEINSKIYSVENIITGQIRAMKTINKTEGINDEEKKREIINEINILKTIDHPNILKIFEFYSTKTEFSFITEICSDGELYKEIKERGPFTERYSAYVMYQIFSGINYCHKINIIHRDLKPENILIVNKDENEFPFIKVCDFGTSKIFEAGFVERSVVGSSYYIAPEVLLKRYNEKCDIWSCGVIMYILLSQRPPFGGRDDYEIMETVKTGQYDLSSPPFDTISEEAKDLIRKTLEMDVNKRITAEEALNHPWFKTHKSKELFNKVKDVNTIKDLITNLKKYKRTSVIQETALAYLVRHFPHIKDVVNACKLFNQIDHSEDGRITKDELYNGINSLYKSSSLKKDIDEIFKNLDMDNDGYIGYEEFVRGAVDKEYFIQPNVLKFAFRYFDKDGSGEITFNEIEELFYESVPDKNQVHEILSAIIKEVDVNNDQKISFDEFSYVMKTMIKQ